MARLPWFLVIQGHGASGLGRARGAPVLMKNEECLPSPSARPGEGERRTMSFKNGLQQMPSLYNAYGAGVLHSKFYKDKQN